MNMMTTEYLCWVSHSDAAEESSLLDVTLRHCVNTNPITDITWSPISLTSSLEDLMVMYTSTIQVNKFITILFYIF